MKHLNKAVLVAATVSLLAIPLVSWASEEDGVTEKEVMAAEGVPPVVPHSTTKDGELRDCLSCHEQGKNGAPPTPHPERKTCTQCHGQGDIKVDLDKPVKGKKKK
jgi:nitrate reductase cytochrome c-type subunit